MGSLAILVSFTKEGYLIHFWGRSTSAAVRQRAETAPLHAWALDHHEPHFQSRWRMPKAAMPS
ncbi:MAG: hypothetical protein R2932_17250 [Caldilineaceae bacterium]